MHICCTRHHFIQHTHEVLIKEKRKKNVLPTMLARSRSLLIGIHNFYVTFAAYFSSYYTSLDFHSFPSHTSSASKDNKCCVYLTFLNTNHWYTYALLLDGTSCSVCFFSCIPRYYDCGREQVVKTDIYVFKSGWLGSEYYVLLCGNIRTYIYAHTEEI